MQQPTCTIEGCDKPSRNPKSAALCKMHYHRWYRHGSVETVSTNPDTPSVSHGRLYRRVSARNHPLADASGNAYEHRVILFDKIGIGPHSCHWCGTEVDWLPKGDPRCLQVDHLNNIGDDNRPENLAPSCGPCNSGRGSQRRHQALVEAGWWASHDTVANLAGGRRTATS